MGSVDQQLGPRSLQIMDFQDSKDPNKPREILLYDENLQFILNQAGDKKVSIISIAGPSRRGKSFFLDFLIRYLEALEKDEPDWLDWENKDKPLTGFKWTTSTVHETSGMLMWSKPFFVKSNGEEIAVLLMDTQGTYDEYTTVRERSAIVGLSLLTSSCLIFNFFTMLQEDCLESLDTYINYGLMAMQKDSADQMETDNNELEMRHPFQRLYFLIRDWNVPTQFSYGASGGKKYLEDKLSIKPGMTKEVKAVRETLKQCFERLDCFLMPEIGEKAKGEGFTGCLAQLSDKFTKNLELVVEDILNPDDVPIKAIFGNEIMAADFMGYFKQYVAVFNCEDTPSPLNLVEATAKISNQSLVNGCKRNYINGMKKKQRGKKFLSNSALNKAHKAMAGEVMKEFKKTRKLGNADLVNSFEEDLIFVIKEDFDRLLYENEIKKNKLVEESKSEALNFYKDLMEEEFEDKDSFVEEKKLNSISSNAQSNSLEEFKGKVGDNFDEKDLEDEIVSLEWKLEEEARRIITDNQNRRMMAQQKMNELIKKAVFNYHEKITENLEDNPFLAEEELKELNEESKKSVIDGFNAAKKVGGKDFIKIYFVNLEESLIKAYEEVQKSYKIKIQETDKIAETTLDDTVNFFDEEIRKDMDTFWEEDELESKSSTLLENAVEDFKSKNPYPEGTSIAQVFIKKVREKILSTRELVFKDFYQAKKDCEESYTKAVEKGLNFYIQDMDAFTNEKEFHLDEDLQSKHDQLRNVAMDLFIDEPKSGTHPNPEQFLDQLKNKIKYHFDKNLESNTAKKDAALAKAKNDAYDCHQSYQSAMMKHLDSAKDMDELNDLHDQMVKAVVNQFINNCAVKEEEFTRPFIQKLNVDMQTSYDDELKDIFDLKVLEREGTTMSSLAEARKYYHEEMEKHYKNNVFMRPKELEALHKSLAEESIKKCLEKTPLSEVQKKDLEAALLVTYKQYEETNDMNVPVDPAIGIDLGTTYSCVAVYLNGKVTIIPNAQGKNTTPSYVCYNDTGFVESVGEPSKRTAYENAENTIYDAKRIIGRKFDDEKLQDDMKYWAFKVVEEGKQVPKIKINNGKTFHPEQISGEVLKEMRVQAEKYLNCTIEKAVITVPAYFTDGQRQATIDAGELAGLKVLNILSEPVAGAIAYKLQHSEDNFRHVLIFDLGGGTFDVAILKISKGEIESLAMDGDTHLGGEDFDQNVMKYCALEFQREHGIDLMDGKDSPDAGVKNDARRRLKRLQLQCEEGKMMLSSCQSVDIAVDGIYNENGQSLDLNVKLSRNKFEDLNEDLFKNTIIFIEKVLKSAGLEKGRIDDIVLVGGSTRIPKVQAILTDFFDGKALNKTVNPDEAVAYGAAVQAAIMNGKIAQESIDYNKIQDVTPMSLGVEVYGGGFSIIIPKNTKIPKKLKEQYRTAHNNQTSVQITIYQGEKDLAVENTMLGEFYLNGVPPAEAGRETIDVTMEINLQGVLQITAVCTSSGDANCIKITEDKRRMGKETIKRILAEAKAGGA